MSAIISIQRADMEINFFVPVDSSSALKDTICNSLQRKRLQWTHRDGKKNWRSRNCKWRQSSANPSDICFRQPISNVQKKLDHVLLITYFINNKKHQAIFIFYGAFLLCGANRKLNDLSMICFSYKTAYLTLCDTIWLLWFGWCLHSVILQYQSIGGPSAFMLLQRL